MTRAAIYCRISKDRAGAGLGVARQEADCRALAVRRDWQVAEVYCDNDVSAYSGKPRPQWQRLLADIRAGQVEGLIGWHVDRLTRSPRELEDVIDLADRHGLALATVTGEVDLATPTGRMVARIMGAAARQECEHKGERTSRARKQAAELGRPPQGPAGYGYRHDGKGSDRKLIIVEAEAAIIRDCAARVLAGETIGSLCRELNARGVPSPTWHPPLSMVPWRPASLIDALVSARISGRRDYIPKSAPAHRSWGHVGEITAVDCWPAIISVAHSDQLRRELTDPARRTNLHGTARKYLLSGLMRCAGCGTKMVGQIKQDPHANVYRCAGYMTARGGGHVSINMHYADTLILDVIMESLLSSEADARLHHQETPADNLHALIRADEDKRDNLAADYANQKITHGEWKTMRAIIEKRLTDNRRSLDARSQESILAAFAGHSEQELRALWEEFTLAQRRAVVSAVFDKITVHPCGPARSVLDENRFEFVPRM